MVGHVQPFVAIVLGDTSQEDAEQLARAVGATAILRPGQPHVTPLHPPDAVIDLATPDRDDGIMHPQDAVIDLAEAPVAPADHSVIDLGEPGQAAAPGHSARRGGLPVVPAVGVVLDPAEAHDVTALAAAVHLVLEGLQHGATSPGGCTVASRLVTDTLKIVDGTGVLLGTADRDEHRWISAPLAGPFEVLAAVAGLAPAAAADENGSPSVRPLIEALIEQGVEVQAISV